MQSLQIILIVTYFHLETRKLSARNPYSTEARSLGSYKQVLPNDPLATSSIFLFKSNQLRECCVHFAVLLIVAFSRFQSREINSKKGLEDKVTF